jgi:hypothetical protein
MGLTSDIDVMTEKLRPFSTSPECTPLQTVIRQQYEG